MTAAGDGVDDSTAAGVWGAGDAAAMAPSGRAVAGVRPAHCASDGLRGE